MPLKIIPLITVVVLSVQDGDTITVKDKKETYKVRMAAIDCPEKKQKHGDIATSVTSTMLLGQTVQLRAHKRDLYNRVIGDVYRESLYVNQYLVQTGHCWAYMTKDAEIIGLEKQAKIAEIGLWSEKNPVPPWEFRKKK